MPRLSVVPTLALLLALASPTGAQPVPTPDAQADAARAEARRQMEERQQRDALAARTLINVDFKGGTVADYLAAVKGASPKQLNVLLDPGAGRVEMRALTLRGITPLTALQAIPLAFDDAGPDGFEVIPVAPSHPLEEDSSLTVLLRHHDRRFGGGREAPRGTEVISIHDLISVPEGLPAGTALALNDVLSVLERTMLTAFADEARPGVEPPRASIGVHEATSILIVQGTPAQLGLAKQAAARLREEVSARVRSAREEALLRAAMKAERDQRDQWMMEAEEGIRAAERRATQAQEAFARLNTLHDSGLAAENEFAEGKAALEVARGQVQAARRRLESGSQLWSEESLRARALLRVGGLVERAPASAGSDQAAQVQRLEWQIRALQEELARLRSR